MAYLGTGAESGTTPLTQSGGLLCQGLGGTASAYLWTNPTSPLHTDHYYATDGTLPPAYEAEAALGYLRQSSGSQTVALTRYVISGTGSHYYSTTADSPSGYSAEATLGYLETTAGPDRLPLARHNNQTTGDYRLTTSTDPPTGYVYQATLGYLRTPTPGPILTTYLRNDLGQVTRATSPTVTYDYAYDLAHRLHTVIDSRGPKILTYTYSAGGRVTSLQDSDGNRTEYLYDPVGRLTGIWAPNQDLVSFAYDAGGRLTEKWFPNGVNTRYTWNPDNTLAQVMNTVGSTILTQHDYTYDGVGNRQTHSEKIGETTIPYWYGYDPLNRLVEVRDTNSGGPLLGSYSYDLLGNRLTKTEGGITLTYLYDLANQLTEIRQGGVPQAALTYDLNGNLSTRVDGGVSTTFTYDAENRLAWVQSGSFDQTYAYDDQGRRVRKTSGGTPTHYLYDGPDILAEYTSWASPTARYTHGPNVDDPLIRATATTTQYYHQDGLGSVVSVSNQSGTVDGTARYDAWGNKGSGTGTIPQYGYTGREPDETGLLYYRARYYDPTLGRFTQRDPIGLQGGINPYSYVANNPATFVDPEGKEIVITRNGNVIDIRLTVMYTGPGITPEVQRRWDEGIQKAWSGDLGPYTVRTSVTSVINPPWPEDYPRYHAVEVPQAGEVATTYIGGTTGNWPAHASGQIAAHEFGHFVGNADKYDKVPRTDPQVIIPWEAWKGNIMAEPGGQGLVDQRNIEDALKSKLNIPTPPLGPAQGAETRIEAGYAGPPASINGANSIFK